MTEKGNSIRSMDIVLIILLIVSIAISGLSYSAIMGIGPIPGPTGLLEVSSIAIPSVKLGETSTITAVVANPSDVAVSREFSCIVNGSIIGSENVTLDARASTTISFSTTVSDVGTYTVNIGGMSTDLVVEGYTIALMAKDMGADWWLAYIGGGKWYLESKGHKTVIGNPEYSESKANSILKTWAANPDVDGAIISGMGVEAIVGGITSMTDAGKLVIITNCEAGYVPEVPFSIMFDSDWGGRAGAQEIVDELTDRYGSAQGTVIMSICDPANPDLNERAEGYRTIFDQYPDIEVHEISAPIDRVAGAKTQCTTLLTTLPKVDAVCSVEYEGTMGCLAALEDEGMLLPTSDTDHVVLTCIDGGPGPVNDALSEDEIDLVIDQPVMAYNALAGYYAIKILKGETVDFTVGQTITCQDADITYTVPGTGITEPGTTWAPATVIDVTEDYGHVRLGTSALLLGKEDLADPALWSNIAAIKNVAGWGF
jgi:ABC-type sugar transport system substrate-binding protein